MPRPRAKVKFEPTPNPDAGKFSVGRTLVEGRRGRSFDSPEAAAGDPLAAPLLELEGVRSVFMVADFVTVLKAPEASWPDLAPRVQAVLRSLL